MFETLIAFEYMLIPRGLITYMVEEFGLLVGDLLKDGHDELELVFSHGDRLGYIRLFAFGLGAPTRTCTGARHGTLRTCAFSSGLFIVLIEPLLVALIHIDRKSTRLNSGHSGESRMPSSA